MKSKLSVKLVLLAASTVLLVGICGLLYVKNLNNQEAKVTKEMNPEAKIEYVKYSAAEIREFQDLLMQRSDLGVQFVFAENNRIELLISEEMYEKHKEQILDGIDESILIVRFGTFKVIDQFGAA